MTLYGVFWPDTGRLDRYEASSPIEAVRCVWDHWLGEVREIRRSSDRTWFALLQPTGAVAYEVYVETLTGAMAGPASAVPGYAPLGSDRLEGRLGDQIEEEHDA